MITLYQNEPNSNVWYIIMTPQIAVGIVFMVAQRYDVLFDASEYYGANAAGLESLDEALAYVKMVCS